MQLHCKRSKVLAQSGVCVMLATPAAYLRRLIQTALATTATIAAADKAIVTLEQVSTAVCML